jgi:hypothetical protein
MTRRRPCCCRRRTCKCMTSRWSSSSSRTSCHTSTGRVSGGHRPGGGCSTHLTSVLYAGVGVASGPAVALADCRGEGARVVLLRAGEESGVPRVGVAAERGGRGRGRGRGAGAGAGAGAGRGSRLELVHANGVETAAGLRARTLASIVARGRRDGLGGVEGVAAEALEGSARGDELITHLESPTHLVAVLDARVRVAEPAAIARARRDGHAGLVLLGSREGAGGRTVRVAAEGERVRRAGGAGLVDADGVVSSAL